MIRTALLTGVLATLALTAPALAQPVEVTQLAAPDLFATGGRATGLPGDLWRDASPQTMRSVLPLLATKPLSPAAAGLARRVLATGANAPAGVGSDPAMAGARADALAALGDREAASAILARTAGVERDPALSRAAAEAALLAGDDARGCAVSDALSVGRDDIYWLRLRAFCQDRAGQPGIAQLTFELAQTQARDPVYGRLMGAKLAGAGDPGAASARNGLDVALSRALGLTPPPTPAAAPEESNPETPDAALSAILGQNAVVGAASLDALISRAAGADAKARPRTQAAALLAAALGPPISPDARGELAKFGAETKAPAGRLLALDIAADQKLAGEAALLALWISLDAGPAGPAVGDRVRIVRALRAVGLQADAEAFAAEGLVALR